MLPKIIFGVLTVLFTAGALVAQQVSLEPVIAKEMQEPVIKIEKANENVQKPEILEQVILFKLTDEKGLEKEYVTKEERQIIEKKVKEYEKDKKINDRAGKIYNINSKFEVESMEEIKK